MQLGHTKKRTKLSLVFLLLLFLVVSNSQESHAKQISLHSNQNTATKAKSSQQLKQSDLAKKQPSPTIQAETLTDKKSLTEIKGKFINSEQKTDTNISPELSSNNANKQGSEKTTSNDKKMDSSSQQPLKQVNPVTVKKQFQAQKQQTQKLSLKKININTQKQGKDQKHATLDTSSQSNPNKQLKKQANKQVINSDIIDRANTQNSLQQKEDSTKNKIVQFMKYQRSNRKVFDCFPYNGEDHLLLLRLMVMSSFVDYFVIVESQYTYTGMKKQLVFDINRFKDYSHKIIYFTLSNFPHIGTGLSNKDHWANNHYQRNSFIPILKQRAKPQDIVFLSDIDEILSKYGFAQYDPQLYPWAVAEMRHYYYYFNRASVFDYNGQEQIVNYWYNGIRVTTFKTIMSMSGGDMVELRRSKGCIAADLSSKVIKKANLQCQGPILRLAGWHFSYVLNDKDLAKKVKSIADGQPGTKIFDYQYQRASSPAPEAYLKDFQLEDADLPIQLIADILRNKQKSVFAPYIVEVVLNQMCDQGYVQKGKEKIKPLGKIKKTRLILNLDPKQRNGKELKNIQCVKLEETESSKQNQNVESLKSTQTNIKDEKQQSKSVQQSNKSPVQVEKLKQNPAKEEQKAKTNNVEQNKPLALQKQAQSQSHQSLKQKSQENTQISQKDQQQSQQANLIIIQNQQQDKKDEKSIKESQKHIPILDSEQDDQNKFYSDNRLVLIFVSFLLILLLGGVYKICKCMQICCFEKKMKKQVVQNSSHRNYLPVDFD